jgi:hypothetical protein
LLATQMGTTGRGPAVSHVRARLIKVAALGGLGLLIAACGTTGTGSSSGAGGFRNGDITDGSLVSASGSSLVLSTSSNGDVTVDFTSSTPISVTGTGSTADITVGSCITATGGADATGTITAARVTVSPAVNGSCATGSFAGGYPGGEGGRPDFTFQPRGTPGGFASDFDNVRGVVTAVSGTAVTVQETGGTTPSITVPSSAQVSTTTTGSTSDLVKGACVAAVGAPASSGTVGARSLLIEPSGPSGCFTGGFGSGGFGGGGYGGFGGFGGAGGGTTTTSTTTTTTTTTR